MTDAFIYDAVRTPRGKGRKDGSLHEVTPVRLAVTALQAIRDRNKLNTHLVDDVVRGCVMPIGELADRSRGGHPDVLRAAGHLGRPYRHQVRHQPR